MKFRLVEILFCLMGWLLLSSCASNLPIRENVNSLLQKKEARVGVYQTVKMKTMPDAKPNQNIAEKN